MERPWIEFTKWPYEEHMWRFQVAAADRGFAACQEFYADAENILEFAGRLTSFPRDIGDVATMEIGVQDPGWAHWVKLHAYVVDGVGHAGLLVETSNNNPDPYRRDAHFVIRCEVASLNSLGQELAAWMNDEQSTCKVELAPG